MDFRLRIRQVFIDIIVSKISILLKQKNLAFTRELNLGNEIIAKQFATQEQNFKSSYPNFDIRKERSFFY